MDPKIFRYLIIAVVISLMVPVFCPAQSEKALATTYKLTGTVISLSDKAQIRVLYETRDNLHFISDFRIIDSTLIKGNLEVGAVVSVTFVKKRVLRDIFRRVALTIEVIQLSVPEEAGQPSTGY